MPNTRYLEVPSIQTNRVHSVEEFPFSTLPNVRYTLPGFCLFQSQSG